MISASMAALLIFMSFTAGMAVVYAELCLTRKSQHDDDKKWEDK